MKGIPSGSLGPDGIFERDWEALTSYQRECVARLEKRIQMEQEAYLTMHPEIQAMLTLYITKMVHMGKRKDILKEAAEYFTRPYCDLDQEIRERLGLLTGGSYVQEDKIAFHHDDIDLKIDLTEINEKHLTKTVENPISNESTSNTVSSSFVSIITSDSTLPTPETVPTPEPTLSEIMFTLISNTVDKAVYQHVDDDALRYDTAYVELSKVMEQAMEIPVIEIREDIAELFYNAYRSFEIDVMAKERIAAEIAWERRMRKKLKRTLRRVNNFKGYETPPTPKSEQSSEQSYKQPPPRPCVCHPKYNYNRYPKDRFGIYLQRDTKYSNNNVTVTPAISMESINAESADDKVETKSIFSKKSEVSCKSTTNKKCAFRGVKLN